MGMNEENELLRVAEYLKKFTAMTGEQLVKTFDPIAKGVDRDTKIDNLGNNAVVNAFAYVLDIYIARMSAFYREKEEPGLYDKIHLEHGQFLKDLIAKYSATQKSYFVEIREEENNDPRGDDQSHDSRGSRPLP
jgi:hypothetical protein